MSAKKTLVETYFDGFRRGDHQQILACLTDDVAWDIVGYTSLAGKEAFDREIENDAFEGRPTLDISRLVEDGETVIALGVGEASLKTGDRNRFAFCTVCTFAGDLIRKVESYIVPLK
jgi:ketosteroid isomerase-like protein